MSDHDDGTTTTRTAPPHHGVTLRCQFCARWNHIDSARASEHPKCGNCGRPFLLDRPYALTDDTFERTMRESTVPVLVDFYADWCGPCKVMAPVIDEVAAHYQGRVLVTKVDTDRAQRVAQGQKISAIPTLALWSAGREVARRTGAVPRAAVRQMLDEHGVTD
ncbi:MAG TPA: thioredoxin [Gemmatimonadaceae bacterium]|nr:thioredoxin [Gemmatimonadaceae bacterium]